MEALADIGRGFSFDLLRRSAPVDEATLARLVRQLRNAGLVWGKARGTQTFRHTPIRDTAYRSQTRAEQETSAKSAVPSPAQPKAMLPPKARPQISPGLVYESRRKSRTRCPIPYRRDASHALLTLV